MTKRATGVVPVARSAIPFVSTRSRASSELVGVEHLLAVQILQPVGLVHGVEVALTEIRSDGHRREVLSIVLCHPAHGAADNRSGGAAEEESTLGQPMASANGVRFLDADHIVHI